MSGFLSHLLLRSMGTKGTVKPRLPVRYEIGLDLQTAATAVAPGPFQRTAPGAPHDEPDRMRARVPVGDIVPRSAEDAVSTPRPAFVQPQDHTDPHLIQEPFRDLVQGNSRHPTSEHAEHGDNATSPSRGQAIPFLGPTSSSASDLLKRPAADPHPSVREARHTDPHAPLRGAAAAMDLLVPMPVVQLPRAASVPASTDVTPQPRGALNPPPPASPSSTDTRPPSAPTGVASRAIAATAATVGLLVDPPRTTPRAVPRQNFADAASEAPATAAPSVHVTIGRIELRSAAPAPTVPRAAAPRPTVDLRDYLRRRNTPDQR